MVLFFPAGQSSFQWRFYAHMFLYYRPNFHWRAAVWCCVSGMQVSAMNIHFVLSNNDDNNNKCNNDNISVVMNNLPHYNPVNSLHNDHIHSNLSLWTFSGVSTTIDPFWDISLDLGPCPYSSSKADKTVPTSLADCLDRFTRPEHLGAWSLQAPGRLCGACVV